MNDTNNQNPNQNGMPGDQPLVGSTQPVPTPTTPSIAPSQPTAPAPAMPMPEPTPGADTAPAAPSTVEPALTAESGLGGSVTVDPIAPQPLTPAVDDSAAPAPTALGNDPGPTGTNQ